MQTRENAQKAYLLLADGTVFEGLSMGATGTTIGEVVFTTGMTGCQETLTDPNYHGQLVTQTFPLVGNYGVNSADGESAACHLNGYIVREWCEAPSNFRCEQTLDWFLKEHKVVGICDIDTRALTRRLREHGTMNGMITTDDISVNRAEKLAAIAAYKIGQAARAVSTTAPVQHPCAGEQFKVAVLDYGCKRSILQSLAARGCAVTLLPCDSTAETIKAGNFDGLLLSNGPGDPANDPALVESLHKILALHLPTFGIGLGHALLALAEGAKTEKLPHGHRGANQPVLDLDSGLTCVTSQNHGYEVVGDSLPDAAQVTHVNANGRGIEGVRYADGAFSVQFLPEPGGSTGDTGRLYDHFIALMQQKKGGN